MKIQCWNCGKTVTGYNEHKEELANLNIPETKKVYCRFYCDECKDKLEKEDKELRELYIRLKKREMFVRACNALENQFTDMYAYKAAIDKIQRYTEEYPDMFDSSYEILAAIVLVHNNIKASMQFRIGRYQVDFLLPELKIVLEIDGYRHQYKKTHDRKRDEIIKKVLGEEWEIIRINTDYLDKNAKKLPEALKRVMKYRQDGKVNWRKLQS